MKVTITILMLICMILSGCYVKNNSDNQLAVSPSGDTSIVTKASKVSSIQGQVFYNKQEIVNSMEQNIYAYNSSYPYKLEDFVVYVLGRNTAYRTNVSYDGTYYISNILPDSYQIIIKTPQYFTDEAGQYTYMYVTNQDVVAGEQATAPIINPRKTYTSEPGYQAAKSAYVTANTSTGILVSSVHVTGNLLYNPAELANAEDPMSFSYGYVPWSFAVKMSLSEVVEHTGGLVTSGPNVGGFDISVTKSGSHVIELSDYTSHEDGVGCYYWMYTKTINITTTTKAVALGNIFPTKKYHPCN